LHWQHNWHRYRELVIYALLVFAFRYLKLHDDIDVDALVTELKLLKKISPRFLPDTFETVRDVSDALTVRDCNGCRLLGSTNFKQSDHSRAFDR